MHLDLFQTSPELQALQRKYSRLRDYKPRQVERMVKVGRTVVVRFTNGRWWTSDFRFNHTYNGATGFNLIASTDNTLADLIEALMILELIDHQQAEAIRRAINTVQAEGQEARAWEQQQQELRQQATDEEETAHQ